MPERTGTNGAPPLDADARARIRAGIERKLAAGTNPPVPRDPLRGLAGTGTAAKAAGVVAVVAAGGLVAAVAVRATGPMEPAAARRPPAERSVREASAPASTPETPAPARPETAAPEPPGAARPEPVGLAADPGPVEAPRAVGEGRRARPDGDGLRRRAVRRPTAPPRVAPATAAKSPRADAPDPESGLAAELVVLDRARRALAAGDAAGALAAAEEHARRFPAGDLAPERESLAVAALCRLGRRDEARKRARRFLTRHPTSPLAPAVRASCAGEDGP